VAKPKSASFYLRGVMGILVLVPALGAVLFSRPWLKTGVGLDLAFFAAGWALSWCGGFLRLWSIVYIGGRKGNTVVSEGPYACCRNPLYLGSLLVGISFAFYAKSASVLLAVVILSFLYVGLVVRSEERQLEGLFGQAWRDYTASVPRLLPRLRWKSEKRIEIDLRAFKNEALRLTGIAAIPLLMRGVETLRGLPGWPHWFTLP
jgi:protein-S-isoprenylcysteine O-methyltransferase Ste14